MRKVERNHDEGEIIVKHGKRVSAMLITRQGSPSRKVSLLPMLER